MATTRRKKRGKAPSRKAPGPSRAWLFQSCWFCTTPWRIWTASNVFPSALPVDDEKAMRSRGFVAGPANDGTCALASVDCDRCEGRAIGWMQLELGPKGAVKSATPVGLTRACLRSARWVSTAIASDFARLTHRWPPLDPAEALKRIPPLLPEGSDAVE